MAKLLVLMITAFVDMIGLVMVVPLLPFYAERMGATGLIVGVLVAAFSLAQLVSAPAWGRLSDRHGRRPTLLLGLFMSAVSYTVFAYAGTLWLLFASRIVQGFGGGTVGVVQAYVADTAAPEDRTKALGWLSAATSLGAVCGPWLGSQAARLGPHAPGLAAAIVSLTSLVFAWLFLRESRVMTRSGEHAKPIARSHEALWRVISHPGSTASRLIWVYAIGMGAFYGMLGIFTMFLARRFAVTAETIGPFFAWFGGMGVLARIFVLGRMVKWLGEARLARLGLVLLVIGMIIFPLSRNYLTLGIAITILPLGTAFTFPCVTALLSRVAPERERGLYMGVQRSFGGVSQVLFPEWDGFAFDRYGMVTPFWSCAAMVLGALVLSAGIGAAAGGAAVPAAGPVSPTGS